MAWERSGVPGGGAVRTSWFDRDLPAMWRVLENQQSDDHWRLVAGWRKAAELTATHLRRLKHYRTTLAEVWPPDRNQAAAAYVARLDFLIQNVRTTHDVAAANYSTLAATVGALAAARRDLKPLHDEYVAKSRAIKDHANLVALNAASEAPTVIGAAPAGAQDLERLNNRGRAIMYTLSHTLVEAEAAIRQPPTYPAGARWDHGNPDVYRNGGGSVPDSPTSAPTPPTSHQLDDIRRGRSTITTTPSVDSVSSDLSGAPASIPSATGIETKPSPSQLSRPGGLTVTWPSLRPTAQPALPGGVIGATPGADERSVARAPVRVNPIGGVIEAKGTHGPAPNLSSAIPPIFNGMSKRSSDREAKTYQGMTETTWETLKGVAPIIQARETHPDDPGPVIGLGR